MLHEFFLSDDHCTNHNGQEQSEMFTLQHHHCDLLQFDGPQCFEIITFEEINNFLGPDEFSTTSLTNYYSSEKSEYFLRGPPQPFC